MDRVDVEYVYGGDGIDNAPLERRIISCENLGGKNRFQLNRARDLGITKEADFLAYMETSGEDNARIYCRRICPLRYKCDIAAKYHGNYI